MPNTIVTSHQAFLTEEALKTIAESIVQSLLDFFNGQKVKNLTDILFLFNTSKTN